MLSVIQSMSRNATSRVKWGGHHGEIFENIYGVLQGGVLSPNLFRLFPEDITDYLDKEKGIHIGVYVGKPVRSSEFDMGTGKLLYTVARGS